MQDKPIVKNKFFCKKINKSSRDPDFHGGTETELLPTLVAPGSETFCLSNLFANFGNFCQLLGTCANCLPTLINSPQLRLYLPTLDWSGNLGNFWFGNCIFFYPLMKSGANVKFFSFLRYVPICVLFSGLESIL